VTQRVARRLQPATDGAHFVEQRRYRLFELPASLEALAHDTKSLVQQLDVPEEVRQCRVEAGAPDVMGGEGIGQPHHRHIRLHQQRIEQIEEERALLSRRIERWGEP